ncbi:hypothetical protein PGH07_01150 [Sulfurovum sp. zt1-1]|uniref:Uncharacterized protein n=1 Tax=Sulfurovum zhangzhouensis TaxID=3019067 RepID=A0ABT7QVG4_9BACT|nr:hypothetical protein [Sulfurovum zhangzhouensis]MDM5270778.1 hypothetical protein [Sulfurovum zhangzhouensis]
MDIEITQNIVLIGIGALIFFMYITSRAWDQVSDELEDQKGTGKSK